MKNAFVELFGLIGLIFGIIIEFSSPDPMSCLPSSGISALNCVPILLVCTFIGAIAGLAIEPLLSLGGKH